MKNSNIIPLVHQLSRAEVDAWKRALQFELPDCNIMEFDQLSKDQRGRVRIAIIANPDTAQLQSLTGIEWVQSLWAGVEKVVNKLPNSQLQIARMIDPELARTMSEAVLAWTLYLHRDMQLYQRSQASCCWKPRQYRSPDDINILILGLGELGRVSALRLAANGYQVSGWSRSAKDLRGINCINGPEALFKAAANTDILVNLLPLTSKTQKLINKELLDQLPIGAKLINFGRGPSIDTQALLDSLNTGPLEHAVLDVFETEPLDALSPLWNHPKITILPHISAPTNIKTASLIAANNIRNYLECGALPEFISNERGY